MNESFGTLRSLLAVPEPDEHAVWSLLEEMYDEDTQQYLAHVPAYLRPLMEDFATSWDPRHYTPPSLSGGEQTRPIFGACFSRQQAFFRACEMMPVTLFRLRLGHPGEHEMTLKQLSKDERLDRVYSLELDGGWVTDNGVKALAKSKHARHLVRLDFTKTMIGPAAMRALAESETFDELRHLELSWSFIGDDGARAIAGARHMSKLRHLALRQCWGSEASLTARGIETLVTSNRLRKLESLSLASNLCDLPSLIPLIESSKLRRLRYLDLSNNHLGDEGVQLLSESHCFPNLEVLVLQQSHLGDAAAMALASSALLPRLAILNLIGERFGEDAMRALREACARHDVELCLHHA